jgi:hypothetical protein
MFENENICLKTKSETQERMSKPEVINFTMKLNKYCLLQKILKECVRDLTLDEMV